MLDDTGIQQLQLQLNGQEKKRSASNKGQLVVCYNCPIFLTAICKYWPLLASLSARPNLGAGAATSPLNATDPNFAWPPTLHS
jgi:hypothetical protein